MAAVGILGGTFDPIHNGHISIARDVLEAMPIDEVRFIPSGHPPHRHKPRASALQRLDWVRSAIAGEPGLTVDDCELHRDGPSYTVETLARIREELPQTPLCFLLGTDAFNTLDSWHRWQEISALAHLVVVGRPGETANPAPSVTDFFRDRLLTDPAGLTDVPAGHLLFWPVRPVPVSATRIRQAIARRDSDVGQWLPAAVREQILSASCYLDDPANDS